MAKKKYICTGCHKCTEPCTVELSGDADMTKDPAKMLHCGTWLEVPVEETEQLPKLTAEVFLLPECPEWAQYASVEANGLAYWYEDKPERFIVDWQSSKRASLIGQDYDASDWRNSLIERPAVAPAWFKPGVLAYNSDIHTFFHVTTSTEYCEHYLEAKVRPFNDDELERKLGQTVLGPFNSKLVVTGFRPKGITSGKPEICVLGNKWLNAEELLTYGSCPQGIKQYQSKEGQWIDRGLSS